MIVCIWIHDLQTNIDIHRCLTVFTLFENLDDRTFSAPFRQSTEEVPKHILPSLIPFQYVGTLSMPGQCSN